MTAPIISREELLACPFCGGEAKCNGHPGGVMGQIYCDGEECFGPRTTALTKQDSIVQWNTRAAPAQASGDAAHWKERHDTVLQKHIECCGAPSQAPTNRDIHDVIASALQIEGTTYSGIQRAVRDIQALYASPLPSKGLPAPAPHAEVREAVSSLTKIAAECHRAKWQFDLTENYKPTAKARHDLIITAFRELHRIGDLALKIRDGFALHQQERGGK